MPLITLRQGSDWAMPASSRVVDRFHVIARRNGSAAVWLPSMAALVTDDDGEPARGFQYETWRAQAVKTSGRKQ